MIELSSSIFAISSAKGSGDDDAASYAADYRFFSSLPRRCLIIIFISLLSSFH